ncbi:hypothetical protein GL4_1344 [Methyloceanibacter caenitepidi]|uniref:Uncharacterized protein n=1 Tax=Methyloceanibacter caenitepidi TaxID=1384459 RepID=A0A0A8K2R7_9HYPH|nr:hypothetical protein GL4_1344 [Methyloceanibacter caenitepidi]
MLMRFGTFLAPEFCFETLLEFELLGFVTKFSGNKCCETLI